MIEERARQSYLAFPVCVFLSGRNYSILVWNETSLQGFRKASKRRYGNVRSPYGREVALYGQSLPVLVARCERGPAGRR